MAILENDYGVKSFNITDSVGQFTYKVRLSEHIDFDPNTGFLYCKDAIVGNVGVQTYKGYELGFADGNRIVKVHRIEEHIFAKESLESLRGKPITLEHPTEMVDSENVKKYGMGTVLDVGRRDGENILVDLVIQDKALIDKVAPEDENGERRISNDFRDLSLGYSAKLLPYQDTNEYVQTNIEYNHLAVVKEGRAANAVIRDSQNESLKGVKGMTLAERIKGLFIKKNADNKTVTIRDEQGEEKIVSVEEFESKRTFQDPTEHDKTITVESETKTVVKEKDGPDAVVEPEKEKDEKEGEKKMKDKAWFDSAMKEALALPDGAYKDGKIQDLNDEYAAAFPKKIVDAKPIPVKDSALDNLHVVKTEEITKTFTDETPKKIDFDFMEKEAAKYYFDLSNPESPAFKDHKEWSDNFNREMRSGRPSFNL